MRLAHLGPDDLELARPLRAALLLRGDDEPAAHDLLLGPGARRDAGARDETRHGEERLERGLAAGRVPGRRGQGEGLAAAEQVGADVLELAELSLVAAKELARYFVKSLKLGGRTYQALATSSCSWRNLLA